MIAWNGTSADARSTGTSQSTCWLNGGNAVSVNTPSYRQGNPERTVPNPPTIWNLTMSPGYTSRAARPERAGNDLHP